MAGSGSIIPNIQAIKKNWPYLIFAAITAVFFFRFLDGAEVFAYKDLSRYFYPLRYIMVDQVRSGILPLWNPYIFYGMPLMASLQAGLFYPLTLVYYILPFDLAFNYYIVIHYFLAASNMFMFMRSINASRPAAALSAIAFAFSGYLLSVGNMNTSLSSVVWLPLVLMSWNKRVFPLLVLSLALMFLGGEPTIIYVASIVLLLWGLVFREGWEQKLKSSAVLFAAIIIVAGLVAVQLFPFLELVSLSSRPATATYDIVTIRSFPVRETVNFILPFFFGNQVKGASYNTVLLGAASQDWLLSPYLGIIPFVFLAFSFFNRQSRRLVLFFSAAAALSMLLAFGAYTPFYKICYKFLPGAAFIRYPVKYLFLTTFSVAALAGLGFDAVRENKRLLKNGSFALFILLAVSSVAYFFLGKFQAQAFLFLKSQYPASVHAAFFAVLFDILKFDIQSIYQASIIMLALLAVFFLRYKEVVKGRVFSFIIIGLLLLDLAAANSGLNIPSDPKVYSAITPNVGILMSKAGIERYFYSSAAEKANRCVYGDDFDAALVEAKDRLAADRLMQHKLFDCYGYESIELASHRRFYDRNLKNNRFNNMRPINLVNARYLADIYPINNPGLKLLKKSNYGYGKFYLYENPQALPRTVILNGAGQAAIVAYQPNRVEIDAKLKQAGELFLSDTYYPGWKVFVNGKEKKINPAHEMFRSVSLEAGAHKISFVYDPFSFRLGAWVSTLTLFCGMIAGAIWIKKRK